MKAPLQLLFLVCFVGISYSQPTPAEQVASKVAKKLKDSLFITGDQQQQIYMVNMSLHQQNQEVRRQYTQLDSLTFHIQQIENSRDTRYKNILSNTQYQMYKMKRGTLINVD